MPLRLDKYSHHRMRENRDRTSGRRICFQGILIATSVSHITITKLSGGKLREINFFVVSSIPSLFASMRTH